MLGEQVFPAKAYDGKNGAEAEPVSPQLHDSPLNICHPADEIYVTLPSVLGSVASPAGRGWPPPSDPPADTLS